LPGLPILSKPSADPIEFGSNTYLPKVSSPFAEAIEGEGLQSMEMSGGSSSFPSVGPPTAMGRQARSSRDMESAEMSDGGSFPFPTIGPPLASGARSRSESGDGLSLPGIP